MAKHVIWVGAAGSTTGFGIIRSIIHTFGDQVHIIAADTNPAHLVAASVLASEFEQVPLATNPNFPSVLNQGFIKHGVDTYIPVHDAEILVAARCRDDGVFSSKIAVLAPKLESVMRCNDKLLTYASLKAAGITNPLTLPLQEASWQENGWIVKPRTGVGSLGVKLLKKEVEFFQAKLQGGDFVVQSPCLGEETTIDVFKSRSNVFFRCIARERIEIKAGVCSKARIFQSTEFEILAKEVALAMDLTGAFNVQVMRDDHKHWSVIDVNPRTGGGTSMSHPLGIHFASANAADLWGEKVEHLLPRLKRECYVVRQPTEFLMQ
jgi:carbamoyl-phosphate synthase large subunit